MPWLLMAFRTIAFSLTAGKRWPPQICIEHLSACHSGTCWCQLKYIFTFLEVITDVRQKILKAKQQKFSSLQFSLKIHGNPIKLK